MMNGNVPIDSHIIDCLTQCWKSMLHERGQSSTHSNFLHSYTPKTSIPTIPLEINTLDNYRWIEYVFDINSFYGEYAQKICDKMHMYRDQKFDAYCFESPMLQKTFKKIYDHILTYRFVSDDNFDYTDTENIRTLLIHAKYMVQINDYIKNNCIKN